ncbi:MAG: metallophosphoesterase family protein [Candidatus Aminicenantia bacterium]
MNKKTFNKFLVGAVLILLILASVIKIHSVLSFPEISDWNYHQLQKIDKTKNEFLFVVFGDNKNSVKTFENLIEKVNKEDAIFAIDIGDLVYDGEKEKFRFFINQIKKLNKPLLTVIGNHEIREDGRANYYELFGKFYYSFAVGNSYFIILDDANEKNLDPWQMDWLKNELQKSQNYKYRFIFMHVPLYDPRKGEYKIGHSLKDLAFADKLNNLFDKNNVSMLFVSHIHGYYRGIWEKTPHIITGGAGAELVGSDPRHYFYHYIKVNVSEYEVKYEVVRVKSPDFELIDRWIHTTWIYIYAFFAIHFLDLIIILTLIYLGFYIIFIKKEWLIWNRGKKKK